MSVPGSVNVEVSLPGMKKSPKFNRDAASSIPALDVSLAAATAGALSTRGGDTEGTLTLSSGHGIVEGDVIAIFWSSAYAYLATAGAVGETTVPFSGALGTALPVQGTAVTVDVMENYDVDFDGDKLETFVATFSKHGLAIFEDSIGTSGDAVLYAADIAAGEGMVYVADAGFTNELEGNAVDEIWLANADSSEANVFSMAGLYNSDE